MTFNEMMVMTNALAMYKSQMVEYSKDPAEDGEWLRKMIVVAGELEQKVTAMYKAQH